MQRVLAASGSTTHMAARPGLSGSSRARAATAAATARLTPAGRGNALRLAMPQHAGAAAAGPRTRAPVRVSAAADPAVKLTGDDLKEANRKQMRTVRMWHCRGHPHAAHRGPGWPRSPGVNGGADSSAGGCAGMGWPAGRPLAFNRRRGRTSHGLSYEGPPTCPHAPPPGQLFPSTLHATAPPTQPPQLPSSLKVFDFELWRKHRSSARYWRHITGIFESRIVSGSSVLCRGLGTALAWERAQTARKGLQMVRRAGTCLQRISGGPLSNTRRPPRSPPPNSTTTAHSPRPPVPLSLPLSQVSGLAAPLGYVAALSTTVALYHVLAEVRAAGGGCGARRAAAGAPAA